jgi:hypothetical protein
MLDQGSALPARSANVRLLSRAVDPDPFEATPGEQTGVFARLPRPEDDQDTHARAALSAAQRIREEVVCLDRLVNQYRAENSRLGYFAAVYREMTASVWRCLEPRPGQRRVAYPALMADFIHLFAGRYFDALSDPQHCTESWRLAFEAGDAPMVIHLLASMNAHIRLDLGLALAAATRDETTCQLFRKDFDIINKLVSGYDPTNQLLGIPTPPGMVQNVAETLRIASPTLAMLDRGLGGALRSMLADRIVLERVHVVDVAEAGLAAIASGRPGAFREVERRRDEQCARVGRMLLRKPPMMGALQRTVTWFERSPRQIIDALRPPATSLVPVE